MKGIRPTDHVLTGLLATVAVLIGVENVTAAAGAELGHPLSTQTPLMIPVFVAAVLPILWRRRAVLPALAVTFGILALSLLAFGWVTRCGFGLPLMAAYSYAIARFGGSPGKKAVGMVGVVATLAVIIVQDAATGGFAGGVNGVIPIALGLALVGYVAGVAVNAVARRSSSTSPASPTLEHAH